METKGLPKSRQGPGKGPKANKRMARAAGEVQKQPFVGIRITSELQRQLDKCAAANRHYFERREPQSLQIAIIKGKQVLGRPSGSASTSATTSPWHMGKPFRYTICERSYGRRPRRFDKRPGVRYSYEVGGGSAGRCASERATHRLKGFVW